MASSLTNDSSQSASSIKQNLLQMLKEVALFRREVEGCSEFVQRWCSESIQVTNRLIVRAV
jgi:hypothetical protein